MPRGVPDVPPCTFCGKRHRATGKQPPCVKAHARWIAANARALAKATAKSKAPRGA